MESLLHQSFTRKLSDYHCCLQWIHDVNQSYRGFPRTQEDIDRIVDLKFAVLFWRRTLLNQLIHDPPPWSADSRKLWEVLRSLNLYISKDQQNKLERVMDSDTYDLLLANQGESFNSSSRYRDLAGPAIELNIVVNRKSAWPFSRWKKTLEFSMYEYEDSGVNYRGLHFRPGDVLLANVNLDGNGLYTVLSDPKRFSSHSAFFVILEDDCMLFPAVIETFEQGVRAVPLNVFLGQKFCAYVEVYRHKSIRKEQLNLINQTARNFINEVRGYNFDSEDTDQGYMSCTSVGRFLHESAGLQGATTKSFMENPTIQRNLEKLDFRFFKTFAPVDYLMDTNFECIGWIDNNQFNDLLSREIVEDYFRELLSTKILNPKRLPPLGYINHWGIKQIRRKNIIGKIISLVEGFDHQSLPKGPDKLLSVITLVESQIGNAIKKTKTCMPEAIQQFYKKGFFSLEKFAGEPEVRRILEKNLQLKWLE